MATLSELEVQQTAKVLGLTLPEREAAWLRAVGLSEGLSVTVLRRGALGGPLHLRLQGGAELALDRDVARCVSVSTGAVAP